MAKRQRRSPKKGRRRGVFYRDRRGRIRPIRRSPTYDPLKAGELPKSARRNRRVLEQIRKIVRSG